MNHVDREIRRFDPELPLARASTPPKSWYVEADFLAREKQTVFARNWQYVGRAGQVREPGCYFAEIVAGEPIVVIRGDDGVLRAFHNSCRHHATAVARGEGCLKELVCPYHGWAYGRDGRLLRATGVGRIENFDPGLFGLVPLAVSELGPLVFIALARPARDPQEQLAPLTDRLRASRWDELTFVTRRRYELECNWKVFVDNYLDGGYHVAHMHPRLAAQLDLDSYQVEVTEEYSIQSSGAGGSSRVGDAALYAFVHPNLMINRYGPWLDINVARPLAIDRTEVVFDYWLTPEAHEQGPEFVERSLAASDQVQQEDIEVCSAVQLGLGSSGYDQGRYAAREAGAHAFHRRLAREIRAN